MPCQQFGIGWGGLIQRRGWQFVVNQLSGGKEAKIHDVAANSGEFVIYLF